MKLIKTVTLNDNIIEYITFDNTKYRRFKYYNNIDIDWCVEIDNTWHDDDPDLEIISKNIELENMYQITIHRKKKLERIIK